MFHASVGGDTQSSNVGILSAWPPASFTFLVNQSTSSVNCYLLSIYPKDYFFKITTILQVQATLSLNGYHHYFLSDLFPPGSQYIFYTVAKMLLNADYSSLCLNSSSLLTLSRKSKIIHTALKAHGSSFIWTSSLLCWDEELCFLAHIMLAATCIHCSWYGNMRIHFRCQLSQLLFPPSLIGPSRL